MAVLKKEPPLSSWPVLEETEKKKKKEVVAVLLVHCHEKEDMIVCPMKQIYM